MSAAFIIDSSITMAWCFVEEGTPAIAEVRNRLERETGVAPGLWLLEVTNVLALAEKRRRITPELSAGFLSVLGKMKIEIDHEGAGRAFDHLLPLCRQHELTSYDALYLDLALRRRLALASLDNELRAAASQLGVELLGV